MHVFQSTRQQHILLRKKETKTMPHVCKTIIVSNPPPPPLSLPNCATTRYATVLSDKVNVKTSIMPCDVFQTRARLDLTTLARRDLMLI